MNLKDLGIVAELYLMGLIDPPTNIDDDWEPSDIVNPGKDRYVNIVEIEEKVFKITIDTYRRSNTIHSLRFNNQEDAEFFAKAFAEVYNREGVVVGEDELRSFGD